MSRSSTNPIRPSICARAAPWLGFAASIAVAACSIVDLRPVTASVEPCRPYEVLPSRDSTLSARFSAEPSRPEAERAFQVRGPDGPVEGDFAWAGSGFSWTPRAPWDPGTRYRLTLRGSVPVAGGREANPEFDLPFFAVRAGAPPAVLSVWPPDGASLAPAAEGESTLRLEFSEPMDKGSVRAGLSFQPAIEFELRWDGPARAAEAVVTRRPAPCAYYTWTLGPSARAADGAPLPGPLRGSFSTDLDPSPPRVERCYALVRSGGAWVEAAPGLDGLASGLSLGVSFTEPIDQASAAAALRLEPGLAGRVEAGGPRLAVFTPERDWPPESSYYLVITTAVKDLSGLRMLEEHRERFEPAVPYLRVLGLSVGGAAPVGFGGLGAVDVSPEPPEGVVSASVRFSAPFDPASKAAAAERVELSAFFPPTLASPALRWACWDSDDTLSLAWEGLSNGTDDIPHYYKIIIRGGLGGIRSSSGSYMSSDASMFFRAVPL